MKRLTSLLPAGALALGLLGCGEAVSDPPAMADADAAVAAYFQRHPEALCAGRFVESIRLSQDTDAAAYKSYMAYSGAGVYTAQVIFAGAAEFLLSAESRELMKKKDGHYCVPVPLQSPLNITKIGQVESKNGLTVVVIHYMVKPQGLPEWSQTIPAALMDAQFKADKEQITGALPLVKTEYGTWEVGLI